MCSDIHSATCLYCNSGQNNGESISKCVYELLENVYSSFPLQALYMLTWPFYTDVNSYDCVGYSERNAPTTSYVPLSAQQGIAMQPVSITMQQQQQQQQQQQAYTPGVVYPAVPPQGGVYRPMSAADPISAPKQE